MWGWVALYFSLLLEKRMRQKSLLVKLCSNGLFSTFSSTAQFFTLDF